MIFFSYGTLLDPEYQRELFGRRLPTRPAVVHDWRAVFTASGYLTIVPRPGSLVRGALVEADDEQLAICDAWEEVPLYTRTPLIAVVDVESIETWAYVRPAVDDQPAPAGILSRGSRADVVSAIRRFIADRRGHTS